MVLACVDEMFDRPTVTTASKSCCTGADLGFYKGGCPIHLKGAPLFAPPPIILTHVTGTKQFFGLRRNNWRQAVVRHLELCQIPY